MVPLILGSHHIIQGSPIGFQGLLMILGSGILGKPDSMLEQRACGQGPHNLN